MSETPSKDIARLIASAFEKLSKDNSYTVEEIYNNIHKKESITKEIIKDFLEKNESLYKKVTKEDSDEIRYEKVKLPTLVLVGNSPNLIERYNAGAGWNRLLKSLEDICGTYLGNTRKLSSFPQRMQAICNLALLLNNADGGETNGIRSILEELTEWLNAVAQLQASPIHQMIANMGFDNYLTTNYDLALERAIGEKIDLEKEGMKISDIRTFLLNESTGENGNYCPKKHISESAVTHIHGIITDLKSLVMSPRSYVLALNALMDKEMAPWLKSFCESEVHICGLNLSSEEILVWYALEIRLKFLHNNKDIRKSNPRAYVYLFYKDTEDKKDYYDKCATRDLLTTYAVNTILVPVRNDDYISAWKLLIGEMLLAKNKKRLHVEDDDENEDEIDDEINKEFEKNLKSVEYGGGRLASRNSNLTTAFESHYMYPYCCWMSVTNRKLQIVKESNEWLCYCKVNGKRFMYSFPVSGVFKNYINDKLDKMNFLLDYRCGKLYEIHEEGKTLEFICCGNEIVDLKQFCKMIYRKKKNSSSK